MFKKKKAAKFLKEAGAYITWDDKFTLVYPHWDNEKEYAVYTAVIHKGKNKVRAEVCQPVKGNRIPSDYDLLACIQKTHPGCFVEFAEKYHEKFRDVIRDDRLFLMEISDYEAARAEYFEILELFGEDQLNKLKVSIKDKRRMK